MTENLARVGEIIGDIEIKESSRDVVYQLRTPSLDCEEPLEFTPVQPSRRNAAEDPQLSRHPAIPKSPTNIL